MWLLLGKIWLLLEKNLSLLEDKNFPEKVRRYPVLYGKNRKGYIGERR